MELPEIITTLPEVELPFPPSGMRANLLQSVNGQVVFFRILEDAVIPPHSHGGQWGTVLDGSVELTIEGQTRQPPSPIRLVAVNAKKHPKMKSAAAEASHT